MYALFGILRLLPEIGDVETAKDLVQSWRSPFLVAQPFHSLFPAHSVEQSIERW